MTAKEAFEKFAESEKRGRDEWWIYWPYFKAGVDYERKREKLNAPIRTQASPASPLRDVTEEEFTDAIYLQLCELADRNSPDDEPDAVICNHGELAGCIERACERLGVSLSRRLTTARSGDAWVPVSERLPQHMNNVLVSTPHGVGIAYCDVRVFFGPRGAMNVTHWQPLPEAPTPARDGGEG